MNRIRNEPSAYIQNLNQLTIPNPYKCYCVFLHGSSHSRRPNARGDSKVASSAAQAQDAERSRWRPWTTCCQIPTMRAPVQSLGLHIEQKDKERERDGECMISTLPPLGRVCGGHPNPCTRQSFVYKTPHSRFVYVGF